ncbi:hypothetical protein FGL86_05960 [Pistricoccus aurantiacus]|uniref:Uncharacterized protein n=1 Tax=Pistricoccus aurantiacus TaxID=1883414 RepID=A0A5B8SND0_9GAMM|nr:hypothetical protein [Pistricoccus aurantiacus]QEA38662.1 hypothetical protein FGL86_05960 [Pistricoccus aurantiacus]
MNSSLKQTQVDAGQLAYRELGWVLPVEVLRSAAGFYLGTSNEDDFPVSRESVEYFKTQEQAEQALNSGNWTQRHDS